MTEIEIPTHSYIEHFKKVTGAFSVCEMIALSNICKLIPDKGEMMELGTHKGKSAVASLYHMKGDRTFHLVEPEFENMDWLLETMENIGEAKRLINSEIKIIYLPKYSTETIPYFDNYAYVFVDSGVHDDLVMEESKMLEDRMVKGGILAYHDYKNQFTAVERAFDYMLSTGKFEKIDIDWATIFNHVRENNLEQNNNSWHESGSEEFPNFVGALRRK